MPKLRPALLAAAATLLSAGAATAQVPEPRTMAVDLPDGSVAQVTYFGDVAPQVTVAMMAPQDTRDLDFYECHDSYGYFGHFSPCFRHRARSGAKRTIEALPSNSVALRDLPPQLVVPSTMPRGSRYHYALISTAPDGKVCTQRTEWLSRGQDKEPRVTRTDLGEGCPAPAVARQVPVPPQAAPKPAN